MISGYTARYYLRASFLVVFSRIDIVLSRSLEGNFAKRALKTDPQMMKKLNSEFPDSILSVKLGGDEVESSTSSYYIYGIVSFRQVSSSFISFISLFLFLFE